MFFNASNCKPHKIHIYIFLEANDIKKMLNKNVWFKIWLVRKREILWRDLISSIFWSSSSVTICQSCFYDLICGKWQWHQVNTILVILEHFTNLFPKVCKLVCQTKYILLKVARYSESTVQYILGKWHVAIAKYLQISIKIQFNI